MDCLIAKVKLALRSSSSTTSSRSIVVMAGLVNTNNRLGEEGGALGPSKGRQGCQHKPQTHNSITEATTTADACSKGPHSLSVRTVAIADDMMEDISQSFACSLLVRGGRK